MKTPILGILGGGQLGRMSALAAARLGIKTIIFTPEKDSPASFVSNQTLMAEYSDKSALQDFAGKVDVISYEFENIPLETITYLEKLKAVYPDNRLLEASQDRVTEKSFLNKIGIHTARWHDTQSAQDIKLKLSEWGANSCILKTTRFGYDGKGQARIQTHSDIDAAWTQFQNAPLIMEEIVDFAHEISVIVARDQFGGMETYGPMLNEHKNHILSRTIVPAHLDPALMDQAVAMTKNLAEKLNLRGVLTLEMFVTKDGHLLANEIAPRTHNSGHWSIDACAVSQFENHVRTVCGLPVGAPGRHSDAEMLNLIGDDVLTASKYLTQENACLHLYGKHDIVEGRKMGHVTFLKDKNT
jgi:5-(carboxyamino)imidazole ribonucleotide synthase